MIRVAGKVGLGALCLLGRGLLRDYVSQAASFRGFPNTSSKYDQGPQVIPLKALQPGTVFVVPHKQVQRCKGSDNPYQPQLT